MREVQAAILRTEVDQSGTGRKQQSSRLGRRRNTTEQSVEVGRTETTNVTLIASSRSLEVATLAGRKCGVAMRYETGVGRRGLSKAQAIHEGVLVLVGVAIQHPLLIRGLVSIAWIAIGSGSQHLTVLVRIGRLEVAAIASRQIVHTVGTPERSGMNLIRAFERIADHIRSHTGKVIVGPGVLALLVDDDSVHTRTLYAIVDDALHNRVGRMVRDIWTTQRTGTNTGGIIGQRTERHLRYETIADVGADEVVVRGLMSRHGHGRVADMLGHPGLHNVITSSARRLIRGAEDRRRIELEVDEAIPAASQRHLEATVWTNSANLPPIGNIVSDAAVAAGQNV